MDEWDYYDVDYSEYDYSTYGYEDLGDGLWYDPSDDSVYDSSTGEWTWGDDDLGGYADEADYGDLSDQGYQDLGDGFWYDPSDDTVFDTYSGEWMDSDAYYGTAGEGEDIGTVYVDNADGGFTDPFGNIFYEDGRVEFPDGTMWDPSTGNYTFEDGSQFLDDGNFIDESGVTWESMGWAGYDNLWQNSQTGDVWNSGTGAITESIVVPAQGGDPTAGATVKGQSTKPTSQPGASGGSSGPMAGGGIGPKPKEMDLNSLTDLLKTLVQTKTAYDTAKAGGTTSAADLAALQRQLSAAAQNVQAAKNGESTSIFGDLFKDPKTILIAAGIGALFLVTALSNRQPQYVMAPPHA